MIDYETYCKILKMHQEYLSVSQIAAELNRSPKTIKRWLNSEGYHKRKSLSRASKLDPYKSLIVKWVDEYPYSSKQVFQRLIQEGYSGGITIVKDYVARIRPRKQKGFLSLSFAPGECAQVDWGQYGSVVVGSTRRRLSFFVMVLCYSRMMYLEFTVMEKMEHFLACHRNAFEFFNAVPESIMVDNLKCAVLKRFIGQAPVFNPKYLDFANHYGFSILPCNVGKGNEKGRVENGVGYVKKNFLAGLDIPNFSAIHPAAQKWRDEIANVRIHGTTHKKPCELFIQDKMAMRALPTTIYDIATPRPARVNNRFRVALDANRYSVPAEYASSHVTLKAYPERICVYDNDKLIARHPRSYDRFKDFENPDHPKQLLQQRRKARDQQLYKSFLAISPQADEYYQHLVKRRLNPKHHIRQIVALSERYGCEKVARALEDSFTFHAFSCEYIANILEQRENCSPKNSPLHVTRRQDLLEIEIPEPNLSIYF